ncbi:779_t:CDS:2 [Acaulospora colombiana]|uniref:779_t:CDS:1 n=1 Tax=Acaulospora colombiana TaxID=27376 RepID=A0ACA9K0C7_9GLOM|nr:779_t:CDS:2 [Acaulospora colombiana]
MDGPVIALVYKDHANFTEEEFGAFEENNAHIFLLKPSFTGEDKCSLTLAAHCIYGFWQDQSDDESFQNTEDPYGIVGVVYRPLYESNIRMACFHENLSPSKQSFASKIPGFYARVTTCVMRSRGQDTLIGTDQNQVLCFRGDDAKPRAEVQLDKRNAGSEFTLIVRIVDGRHIILDAESGKILYEIQTGFELVAGEFLHDGFEVIIRLPGSFNCDPSHWEVVDVREFGASAVSSDEPYGEIRVTDSSHMSSLLDSLSTRVHDGTAQIRKIEETLNQKHDLLSHCDSLLESFTNTFAFNSIQQTSLTKRNLRVNRPIEKLIPLLSDTPMMVSSDEIDGYLPRDRMELQVLEARAVCASINHFDKIFLDISIVNNVGKDLYAIHLVAYPKNVSRVFSSMIRIHSPYINVLAAGQREDIFTLIDLPLDPLLCGLEFGVIIWYQTESSTADRNHDEHGWHSIYIEKILLNNMIKNGLDKFHPSITHLIIGNPISLHNKPWDLTMLPFILEQYLGMESDFLEVMEEAGRECGGVGGKTMAVDGDDRDEEAEADEIDSLVGVDGKLVILLFIGFLKEIGVLQSGLQGKGKKKRKEV